MTSEEEMLPISVLLPSFSDGWTEIYDSVSALHYLYFSSANTPSTGDTNWDKCGVYILLGEHDEEGNWKAYVGQAVSLCQRLADHKRKKDFWVKALFIQRDTTYGFSSADTGWLEAALYELLGASVHAKLTNAQVPKDETLPRYNVVALENLLDPISSIMRLIGYDPTSEDDATSLKTERRSKTHHSVSLKELFDAGYLHSGTTLVGTNLAWSANAAISEDGTILYDGNHYSAPSAAATAAVVKLGRERAEINGWDYWAVEDNDGGKTKLSIIRKRYETATGVDK